MSILSRSKLAKYLTVFAAGFLSGCCLFFYLAVCAPDIIFSINYTINFTHLELTKKLIMEKSFNSNNVYVYSENSGSNLVKIETGEEFEKTLEEAFEDFPKFVLKKHGIAINKDIKVKSLKIVMVSEKTYKTSDKMERELTTGFTTYELILKRIYLLSPDFKFKLSESKGTLRHEIFHYLAFAHKIEKLLPHKDAYDFGNLK